MALWCGCSPCSICLSLAKVSALERAIPSTAVSLLAREVVANLALAFRARPRRGPTSLSLNVLSPLQLLMSRKASTLAWLHGFELSAAFRNLTTYFRLSEGIHCTLGPILLQAFLSSLTL